MLSHIGSGTQMDGFINLDVLIMLGKYKFTHKYNYFINTCHLFRGIPVHISSGLAAGIYLYKSPQSILNI